MKKKLWIINQFANTIDMPGHTRQYDLSIFFRENGILVSVFSSDFNLSLRKFLRGQKRYFFKEEVVHGVKWIWLSVIQYNKNDWRRYLNILSFNFVLFCQLFVRCLIGLVRRDKPDLILASSPQLPAAFLSMVISKLYRIPFIFEVRDLWPKVLIEMGGFNKDSILIKLLSFMENSLYNNSTSVVVLSKGCIKYVKEKGAQNVIFLPNGANLKQFKFAPLPRENEIFSSERPFKIVYSGAHGEANGLENVINAAHLLEDYPIRFYFIGDGPEKDKLKLLAYGMNSIVFEDPISKNKIPHYLAKADAILISLSNLKLFSYGVSPNKLFDAYAIGRPVITTIPGLINDEVNKFKLGITSPPEDPLKLASAIKTLYLKNREEREQMGLSARLIAEKYYSRELISSKYLQLIKDLI